MKTKRNQTLSVAGILAATCALIPQAVHAQERIPFLAEGKTWSYVHFSQRPGKELIPTDTAVYRVLGDTLVAGRSCKQLETEMGTVAAYQQGRDIWIYPPQSAEPKRLYTFDCTVGDSITLGDIVEAVARVERVDSFLFKGDYYRKINYSINGGTDDIIYSFNELTGSRLGIVNSPLTTGIYVSLLDVTLHGESLLKQLTDIPSATLRETSTASAACYSLQGTRLPSPPRKGIYILGGKKHMAK